MDYIIIGAHKAGTSWVHKMFQQLPDFSKMPLKEFHFFDNSNKYDDIRPLSNTYFHKRIIDKKWLFLCAKLIVKFFYLKEISVKFLLFFFFSKYDDNWYVNFFKYFKKIKGDITPSYSTLEKSDINRMFHTCFKSTKIIFILRDPIQRSWSNFKHAQKLGLYKNATEKQIIKIINSDFVTNRSDYLQTISNYKLFFSDQQFKLFYYDELKNSPDVFLKKIVKFIGGDQNNVKKYCNTDKKVNFSNSKKIPLNVLKFLKNKYENDMKTLSEKYGGYCNIWYNQYYND